MGYMGLYYALQEVVNDKIENYLNIIVIDDKRCSSCNTDQVILKLKQIKSLTNLKFERKDFSDKGVEKYLIDNNISVLPAIIFSTSKVDDGINPYLMQINSGEYSLSIGAKFNPFEKRSERGFNLIEEEAIKEIDNSYIKGNINAKITWLEYSDLECPYCAKLHNSGTIEKIKEKYGDKVNFVFNHFPLNFHKNAQTGAEILECVGEKGGSGDFYALLEKSFSSQNSSKDFLLSESVKLGHIKSDIEKCLDNGDYTDKVSSQMYTGSNYFNITGTPGNVLINNKTGEYLILSGAYPVDSFIESIEGAS